jgi:hypothetical protein
MPSKKLRAIARIEQSKKLYADGIGISAHLFVLDMLVDLHHYCEFHRIDMAQSVSRAEFIYNQESKS